MRRRFFKFGGAGHFVYKAWWHFSALVCEVFGRIELYGYENVPKTPCIIVANHVSFLDPMAVGFFHETELCAVARDTLFEGAFNNFFFRSINAIPVHRGRSGNLGAFREVLRRVRMGQGVIIFPEGTRSADGMLQKGKPGAGLLAIKSGVPILPLRTFGFEEVLPRSNRLKGGVRLVICAGRPVMPAELDPGRDAPDREQKIVDAIMARIADIKRPDVFEF